MARYIDADAIPWISLFPDTKKYVLMDTVNKMPAADVVEVVRCEDCRFCRKGRSGLYCSFVDFLIGEEDYCSKGAMKDDG